MEGTAAIERAHVIYHALIVVDECGIDRLVAGTFTDSPAIKIGLGQPKTINSKRASGVTVTKNNNGCIGRRLSGKTRRTARCIQGFNIEADAGQVGLSGNYSSVVPRTPVNHRNTCEVGRGINAVK